MQHKSHQSPVASSQSRGLARIAFCLVTTGYCLLATSVWAEEVKETSPNPPPPINKANLVAAANGGTVVSAKSELDKENWRKENLIDGEVYDEKTGKGSNGWASKKLDFPQEIVFAFKNLQTHRISRVVINPTTPDPPIIGRWIKDFEILVSTQTPLGPYRSVFKGTVQNEPRPQSFTFTPVEAKFVKLRILSNWGSDRLVSLGEFEVYESAVDASSVPTLDELIARLEQLLADLKRFREVLAAQESKSQ